MNISNEEKPNLFHSLFKSFNKEEEPLETNNFNGPSSAEDLGIRFAENFTATGGKFIYCQDLKEMILFCDSLKEENNWNHVFIWDFNTKRLLEELNFQNSDNGFFMDNSDAALSGCFALLADEGVVMLHPSEATNRRLTSFPPHHLIIASKNSLVKNLDEALDGFRQEYFDKLPSLIELNVERRICKANHARLLNAEGTPNVYVFFIDNPSIG